MTLDPEVMKEHSFDPEFYSCIYTLRKIDGSKSSRVFSVDEINSTISFDGSCESSYSLRSDHDTKQSQASISRIRNEVKQQSSFCCVIT